MTIDDLLSLDPPPTYVRRPHWGHAKLDFFIIKRWKIEGTVLFHKDLIADDWLIVDENQCRDEHLITDNELTLYEKRLLNHP